MVACRLLLWGLAVPSFKTVLLAAEQALIDANIYCGHGYDSPHDEAVALVLAAAQLPSTTGKEVLDMPWPPGAQERLTLFLEQRTGQRLPTAYIIGEAWLGPLMFKTDTRALIPRSPIMGLIGNVFEPWWQGGAPSHVVDVCCGGGSLGLLAAWTFPDARVSLLDIDPAALALAEENRQLHQLDNVSLQLGDLLAPVQGQKADIILANPPYVDAGDMASLPAEYHHEPRLALAAGDDGLDLVHRLLVQAADILTADGLLVLEVGNSWPALEQAYPDQVFIWLNPEVGGHGLCVLYGSDLIAMKHRAETWVQQL